MTFYQSLFFLMVFSFMKLQIPQPCKAAWYWFFSRPSVLWDWPILLPCHSATWARSPGPKCPSCLLSQHSPLGPEGDLPPTWAPAPHSRPKWVFSTWASWNCLSTFILKTPRQASPTSVPPSLPSSLSLCPVRHHVFPFLPSSAFAPVCACRWELLHWPPSLAIPTPAHLVNSL